MFESVEAGGTNERTGNLKPQSVEIEDRGRGNVFPGKHVRIGGLLQGKGR